MMIIPNNNIDSNTDDKRFTIEYTKEELDKITLDFVTQMNIYISKVNDHIIKTIEEIEQEVETVPPTTPIIELEQGQQQEKVLK